MKLQLLAELFDTTGQQRWHNHANGAVAEFTVAGKTYEVHLNRTTFGGIPCVTVGFYLQQGEKLEYQITGTGSAAQVLGMVLKILDQYVQQHRPRLLFFTAEEPSRQRLYAAMVRRLAARDWFPVAKGNTGTMLVWRAGRIDSQQQAEQLVQRLQQIEFEG